MAKKKFAAFLRDVAVRQPLPEFFIDLPLDAKTGKHCVGENVTFRKKTSAGLVKAMAAKYEYE